MQHAISLRPTCWISSACPEHGETLMIVCMSCFDNASSMLTEWDLNHKMNMLHHEICLLLNSHSLRTLIKEEWNITQKQLKPHSCTRSPFSSPPKRTYGTYHAPRCAVYMYDVQQHVLYRHAWRVRSTPNCGYSALKHSWFWGLGVQVPPWASYDSKK